jgi:hypothetical protein
MIGAAIELGLIQGYNVMPGSLAGPGASTGKTKIIQWDKVQKVRHPAKITPSEHK